MWTNTSITNYIHTPSCKINKIKALLQNMPSNLHGGKSCLFPLHTYSEFFIPPEQGIILLKHAIDMCTSHHFEWCLTCLFITCASWIVLYVHVMKINCMHITKKVLQLQYFCISLLCIFNALPTTSDRGYYLYMHVWINHRAAWLYKWYKLEVRSIPKLMGSPSAFLLLL